jgi:hypothetical protein
MTSWIVAADGFDDFFLGVFLAFVVLMVLVALMFVALRRQRMLDRTLLERRGRVRLIGALDRGVVGMRDIFCLLLMGALVFAEFVMMVGNRFF